MDNKEKVPRNVYLIDFENVKSDGLKGAENLQETDRIIIFYSNNCDTLSFAAHKLLVDTKANVEYQKIASRLKYAVI